MEAVLLRESVAAAEVAVVSAVLHCRVLMKRGDRVRESGRIRGEEEGEGGLLGV